MPDTCRFCGSGISIDKRCVYCTRKYCLDHLLPESHNCPGVRQTETLGPDFRAFGDTILASSPRQHCIECGEVVKTNRRLCFQCRKERRSEKPESETDHSKRHKTQAEVEKRCDQCGRYTSNTKLCNSCRSGDGTWGNSNTCKNCNRNIGAGSGLCFKCKKSQSSSEGNESKENRQSLLSWLRALL
jgi:hypothetical protein